jgi:DNA-binding CsgD family transcriptional regulator
MINEMQPALVDGSYEFFNIGDTIYQLCAGGLNKVDKLPEIFTNLLSEELRSDSDANKWLTKLGFISTNDRIEKFYRCNYGASDSIPDICIEGKLGAREYVSCQERGSCPAEGFICKFPCGLSKLQIEISIAIASGKTDDQITYEKGISTNTIRYHKNRIEQKIEMLGKPAIAAWAARNLMK